MKRLKDKANVNGVSTDYPFGSVRNKTLTEAGTKYDFEMMSDIFQFFEKMFDASGLVANGLPDNNANGFQLFEALKLAVRPYKSYNALLSQSSTGAPVAIVLGNNSIGNIVFTRISTGIYAGTLTGAFTVGKTQVFAQKESNTMNIACQAINANQITIRTTDSSGVASDDKMNVTSLEIRVFD